MDYAHPIVLKTNMNWTNSKVGGRPVAGSAARRPAALAAAGVAAVLLAATAAAAQATPPAGAIRVELNAVEPSGTSRCRLTFVVENTGGALETLRLDLAAFGRDGAVQRRMAADLGPLRAGKTNLRAFDLEGVCDALGAVLVNDVTACAPIAAGDCLDRLTLSHRGAVRLFK
jgi:hypothetical protein